MPTTSYKYVKKWRNRLKDLMVYAFGGQCAICGYSKCNRSLDFHHIDPSQKDINIGSFDVMNFDTLVAEADKCVMLCANCHREVHEGVTELPKKFIRFDQSKFENARNREINERKRLKAEKLKMTMDKKELMCRKWVDIDVVDLRNSGMTWTDIGKKAGVTGTAAKKRYIKLIKQDTYRPVVERCRTSR